MQPTFEEVIQVHRDKMKDLQARAIAALEQLDDEDVHWRSGDESNSISNIVIHVCGNLKQRFIAGLGGEEDSRRRDDEFNDRMAHTRDELLNLWNETFAIVHQKLDALTQDDLAQRYTIQDHNQSVIYLMFSTATHTSEHVGQILYIAKLRRGEQYRILGFPHQRR